jgi:hypothetical protein
VTTSHLTKCCRESAPVHADRALSSDAAGTHAPKRRELLVMGAASFFSTALGLLAAACDDDPGTTSASPDGGPGDASQAANPDNASLDAGGAPSDASEDASDSYVPPPPTPDAAPLNALLGVAYRASAAYEQAKQRILTAPESDPRASQREVLARLVLDFQAHHEQHAAALVEAVEQQRGTPISELEAMSSFAIPTTLAAHPTLTNAVKYLASTERVAIVGHNVALEGFVAAGPRYLAAVIEGTMAQHLAVLLTLLQRQLDVTPALTADKAGELVKPPFVRSVGGREGLDDAPASYFM